MQGSETLLITDEMMPEWLHRASAGTGAEGKPFIARQHVYSLDR